MKGETGVGPVKIRRNKGGQGGGGVGWGQELELPKVHASYLLLQAPFNKIRL